MALHTFIPGESAQVAENLDANFSFLLGLIQAVINQSPASASGSSTAQAVGAIIASRDVTATGTSTAQAVGKWTALKQSPASAAGVATDNYVGSGEFRAVAAAAGNGLAFGIGANSGVATATGVATDSYVGSAQFRAVAAASGTSATDVRSARNISRVASALGTSATDYRAQNAGAVESTDPTFLTGPTQASIVFSSTPGQVSTTLYTANLTANPGIVIINSANDTSTANVVELYYSGHVLYRQNVDNTWFRWASAGTWTATASPLPAVVQESVEGFFINTASATLYSSTKPGTPAASTATVGNGLDAWSLSAVPGFAIINSGSGGVTQNVGTANVTQLYYHNHTVWQQNSSNLWWFWTGTTTNTSSDWTSSSTSPVPTTPQVNVQTPPTQNVNQTFTVSGTYQDFTGTGNPVLQYADNPTVGAQTTTWNASDKSASISLTNASQTASSTADAVSVMVRSTTSFNSGKKMFEVTAGTITNNWMMGIANSTESLSGFGESDNSIGMQPNWAGGSQAIVTGGAVVSNGANNNSADGEKITCCVDMTAKLIWFTDASMRAAGNPWNNSSTANPGTGVGGISFNTTGSYFLAWSEFDTGGAGTLNTLGPFAVSIPTGFGSWDTSSGSTTWQSLPSNVGVTPSKFSFVHPPVATQNAAFVVAVRDSASTGVVGQSKAFQVQNPGVLTLSPMVLKDNSGNTVAASGTLSFSAGQPAGTTIGTLTIPASGGSFTGTIGLSDSTHFQTSGTGGSRQLQTAAVLAAQTYSETFTATMAGAVNSGETLAVSLLANSEAATATSITTTGTPITTSATPGTAGSSLTWALVTATGTGKSGLMVSLNGTLQTITNQVTQLYYINHTLYILEGSPAAWTFYNGTALTGGQLTQACLTSSSTPIPNITLSSLTFQTSTNGATGITASLMSAGAAMSGVVWTEDSTSFNFVGNGISTTGLLPAGNYPVNVTATVA